MKSERRHDLKTNALARGLEGLPNYWRDYGSRALLVVVVALIVYLLVRYWNDRKASQAQQAALAMTTIQEKLEDIDRLAGAFSANTAQAVADQRQKDARDVEDAIDTVLDHAHDARAKANAYVARGELNWKLANLPELPGADTRPSLKLSNRDKLLDNAKSAYEEVLRSNSGDALDEFSARMGLAAIAEDKRDWGAARQQYQLAADSGLPEAFRDYARKRLTDLSQYQKPVLIAPPEPQTQPSTEPAILGPATPLPTQPSTSPTNSPTTERSAPTTGPG